MKRIFKLLLSTIALSMFLACMTYAELETISNTLTFDDETGILNVYGAGSAQISNSLEELNREAVTKVIVNEGITGISLSSWEEGAFFPNLKSVVLPNSLKKVEDFAFFECELLTEITLPKNVNEIGESAFRNCQSLKKINIPSGVTELKEYTFLECESLKTIKLPDSIKSISNRAFSDSGLESITIPNNCESIDSDAFANTKIKNISLPASVKIIAAKAFSNLELDSFTWNIDGSDIILSIVYGNGNGAYGEDGIFYDSNVKNIEITGVPKSADIKYEKNSEFDNTDNVLSVLKAPVAFLNDDYFGKAKSIYATSVLEVRGFNEITSHDITTDITIDKNIDESVCISGACDKLTTISIPFVGRSADSIGVDAILGENFADVTPSYQIKSELTNINPYYYIPEALRTVIVTNAKKISNNAFQGCHSIETIELNEGIKTIGQYAFADMGFLTVKLPKSLTAIGSNAFKNTDVIKLIVPADSYALDYAKTNGYKYEIYGAASCKHSDCDYKLVNTQYSQFSNGDIYFHNITEYYDKICNDCGKTVEKNARSSKESEAHEYSDNKCTKCGYEQTESQQISLSTSSLSFNANGDAKTFNVTFNGNYTITSGASWININPSSASGNKTIKVTCNKNTSSSSRIGYITVAGKNSSLVSVRISQEGNVSTPPKDTTEPTISISASPSKTTYNSETVTFTASVSDSNGLSMVYVNLDNSWKNGKYVYTKSTSLSYSVATANLSAGTHTIEFIAQDIAGNTAKKSYTFTKAASAKAPFPATKSDYSWASQYQLDFLNLVNTYRSWYGVAPLILDTKAVLAANEMAGYNLKGTSYTINNVLAMYGISDGYSGYKYNNYTNCNNAQNLFIEHVARYKDIIINSEYTKLGIALNYYHPSNPYWYILYIK